VNGGNPAKANQFQVYDVKPGKGAKKESLLFDLEDSNNYPGLVAWSSDDSHFAGWFKDRGSRIFFWNAEGKKDVEGKKEGKRAVSLPGDFDIQHVQFIGPEKLVAVGTAANKARAFVVNAATHKIESNTEFTWENPQEADVVVAVSPTGKHFAITSSPGFRVQLFDIETGKRLRDVGRSFPFPDGVAWGPDGRSISWTLGNDRKGDPIPSRGLNLSTLRLLNEKEVAGFKSVHHPNGYKLDFDKDKRVLSVLHEGKRIATTFGSPVHQYTSYKDADGKLKLIVLAKWGSRLSIIDPETGKLTDIDDWSEGTAISVSPDGKFLLLANTDQALTIYNLDGPVVPQLYVSVADQDWIVSTPRGFYASTFNGERMMGFTSRTDSHKPLNFYPVERFRKQLYRPELIQQVLERGSVLAAIKATKTAPVEIERVLPPSAVLELLSQKDNKVKVRASATTANGKPVEALRLQIDGRSLLAGQGYFEPKPGQKAEVVWEDIVVPPGTHQLSVLVRGSDSSDRSNTVTVSVAEPEEFKPRMFALTIGINYKWDKKLKDNPGWLDAAENDAETILKALKSGCVGKGNRFRELVADEPLRGEKATKPAILQRLKEIREKGAKPGDLVVIFYAGHGVAEGREFYMLTADLDPDDIKKCCLSGSELREELKSMPCQVLLIFDACQSGKALDKFASATDEVGRALANDEAGVTVLAAAMAHENAGEKGDNGRLTLAMRDTLALEKGAFFDKDAKIMNVRHLYTRVEDLVRNGSKGKQNPVLLAPWSTPPIVIRRIPN